MGGLIILVFLVILFWIALVRPQRAREQQQLIADIEAGDEIVSAGGLYGTVKAVDGDVLHVEIAEGLQVRMARNAVVGFVEDVETDAADGLGGADEAGETAESGYPSGSADDRTA